MTNIKNLFPVGSVVLLKETTKKLMIIGILMNNGGVKYDYIGVPFPEGYMDQEHMYLFNHEDVEKVDYLGYINTEMQLFRGTLAEALGQKKAD